MDGEKFVLKGISFNVYFRLKFYVYCVIICLTDCINCAFKILICTNFNMKLHSYLIIS